MSHYLKFRKKPVVIEAVQWDGDSLTALRDWGCPATMLPCGGGAVIIGTLEDGLNSEAVHIASVGDWIIKGIKGEFYPCKPDIFAATYEPERVDAQQEPNHWCDDTSCVE